MRFLNCDSFSWRRDTNILLIICSKNAEELIKTQVTYFPLTKSLRLRSERPFFKWPCLNAVVNCSSIAMLSLHIIMYVSHNTASKNIQLSLVDLFSDWLVLCLHVYIIQYAAYVCFLFLERLKKKNWFFKRSLKCYAFIFALGFQIFFVMFMRKMLLRHQLIKFESIGNNAFDQLFHAF